MKHKLSIVILLQCLYFIAFSQDSLHTETNDNAIEEIVVTATKTATKLEKSTVPLSQIVQKYIKATGSIKLADLLLEQTGIQLSTFLGTGVQLQGLSAEYTLILLNGEPIVGKNAGVVDLSRIVVSNIKKVEIVKGPVSCLYGSDAMGGVINIITEDAGKLRNSVDYSVQYKTPAILTNSLFASFTKKKVSFENSITHNFSNGYQTNKETIYKEGSPYNDFTINNKLTVRVNDNWQTGIGFKYYFLKLKNVDEITNDSNEVVVSNQVDKIHEFNFSPFVKFSKKNIVLNIRSYNSFYKSTSHILAENIDTDLYSDSYKQLFNKLEAQLDYSKNGHVFTAGAGGFYTFVKSNRNIDKITQHQEFIYLQYQYDWKNRIMFNVGNRTDFPNDFKIQWISPKASARFNINKYFAIKVSGGRGYKAPDIRQQYLNFTNTLVGYSVFGANVAVQKLEELERLGDTVIYSIPKDRIKPLSPESSWAFNAEVEIKPIPSKLTITANYFRNQIKDLIEAIPTAIKSSNNGLIYTYYNLNKVYTQGVEANISYQVIKNLNISVGYNFVEAKDYDVLKNIEDGKVFRRDPLTYETVRVTKKEYGGLLNRSKHSMNVKIYYENKKYDFNTYVRVIYRGKYGWSDLNNNQILDAKEEYAPGYVLLNFSFTKTFKDRYHVMVGLDNMLNKKLPQYIPSMQGITGIFGFSVNFLNNK